MSTATAVPEVQAEGTTPPKAKRGRMPLIIGAVVALAAAGGGAYFFFGHKVAKEGAEPEKKVVEVAPTYLPLETFTVNLQPEVGDQYLQITMSLKVADPLGVEELKTRMPEIRNRLLLMLSGKKASELASSAGKEHLGIEVQDGINTLFKHEVPPAAATAPAAPAEPAAEAPAAEQTAAAPAEAEGEVAAAPTPLEKQLAVAAVPPKPAKVAAVTTAHLNTPVSGVLFTSFIIQ
jgi:flagellar protein FliL